MPDEELHHDDTDVEEALKRETQDGAGDLDDLPPSDFTEGEDSK